MACMSKLSLDGFRNLQPTLLEPHGRLNIFLGGNGQGKTNLLEAIHIAGALRPLRKIEKNLDLIQFHSEQATIRAIFDLEGPLPVDIRIESGGRQARIAGKRTRDITEISRRISVVSFTPEDLAMVRGSPDGRRRVLDGFAYSLQPGFARVAKSYSQLLERRNRLLKERWIDPELLEAYTLPLIDAGAELTFARLQMVEKWRQPFQDAVASIGDGQLEADLGYMSSIQNQDLLSANSGDRTLSSLKDSFEKRLQEHSDKEKHRRVTLVGPHLDDMAFYVRERRARHFASQGEARAIVLALRLSQVRMVTASRDSPPLLLLDDVAGELDPKRAECLFSLIDEVGAQTFVTTTHLEALPSPGECSMYAIQAGKLDSIAK
jgi:DNA replication and repair protein RecF